MATKSSASGVIDLVDTFDMCKIVKGSWAFNGVASTAALLLPLMAMPESHLQTGAGSAVVATAHLNFKIVIPQVLSLQVGGESEAAAGARTVAIMSNGRTVTLQSTIAASGDDRPTAHGNLILNAGARRVIAQDAQCAPQPIQAGAVTAVTDKSVKVGTQQVCTASMP
jgi:hypothetical protein